MSDNNSTRSGGIGFTGLLTLLFIALKLLHKIDWSWWWVLSPIWISTALVVVILVVAFVVMFVVETAKDRKKARR